MGYPKEAAPDVKVREASNQEVEYLKVLKSSGSIK